MFSKNNILRVIAVLCVMALTTPILTTQVRALESPRWSDTCYADFLYSLGLFLGTDKGFELERKFNRDEATVMLVRLMGAEEEALEGKYSFPFDDVDDWAHPYVGWLYENGVAQGMSTGKFGSKSHVTAHQYVTFLVRCLGYSEAAGDFTYNGVFDFLLEKKLFENDSYANTFRYYRPDFIRYDCTELTFSAMFWKMKDSDTTLADYLMENGVFSVGTFAEGLRPFAFLYDVNKDGKIVRKLDEYTELPWLGVSEESYMATGWSFDNLLTAFTGPNQSGAYAVDIKTLARKAKLSDLDISLLFGGMYNGWLYYDEYEYGYWEPGAANLTHLYKVYDVTEDEVTTLLVCQRVINENDCAESKFAIIGIVDGKCEYNIVDFDTATVTNLISESAESIYAQFFHYSNDLESSHFTMLFLKIVFDGEIRYYVYSADTLNSTATLSHNANTDIKLFDNKHYNPETPYIFYDNNTFFGVGSDKKINVLTAFDKPVVSAYLADNGGLYVLTGSAYFAEELGVIGADGNYTVLAPDIFKLTAIEIIGVSDDGNVTFISDYEMRHPESAVKYVYDAQVKAVVLP